MWKSSSEGVGVGFGTIGEGRDEGRVLLVATPSFPLPDEAPVCRPFPPLTVTPRLGSSFEEIGEREFTTLAKCLPTPTGARRKTGWSRRLYDEAYAI